MRRVEQKMATGGLIELDGVPVAGDIEDKAIWPRDLVTPARRGTAGAAPLRTLTDEMSAAMARCAARAAEIQHLLDGLTERRTRTAATTAELLARFHQLNAQINHDRRTPR